MHGILHIVVDLTIKYMQQLRNNTILSCTMFRNVYFTVHSNVMLRFMVQALQDQDDLGDVDSLRGWQRCEINNLIMDRRMNISMTELGW